MVGVFKTGCVYRWYLEDGVVWVLVTDPVGRLQRDLRLPDATKAFDGSSLIVVLIYIRPDPFLEL